MRNYNVTIKDFGEFELETYNIFYALKGLRCYLGLPINDFEVIKVEEIKEDNSRLDITILINN